VEGQQSHPTPSPERLQGLQLGRGLAALTVICDHSIDHSLGSSASDVWQLGARYGVTLFFIISGFIMVQTTGTGRFDPLGFISRRIRRVAPIYWIATLLVAALALLAPALFKRTTFDLTHLIASLAFAPMYDPAQTGQIWPMVRLGWTINYEMAFYAVFALTFALGLSARVTVISTLFIGCFIIGQLVTFDNAAAVFYTRIDILGFVCGLWLGLLQLRGRLRLAAAAPGLLLASSLVAFAAIAFNYTAIRALPATQLALIAICTSHVALLLILVDQRGRPAARALLYIGDASFSIYLFHMFALGAVTAVGRRLPDYMTGPTIVAAGLAGISIGILAYELIERPLNRLMRGRRPLTAAQIGEGAAMAPLAAPSTETQ
jgi:exopolysaccharide production protein ExoZ